MIAPSKEEEFINLHAMETARKQMLAAAGEPKSKKILVTLDAALYKRAREKAKNLGLSFSAYVRLLICTDLGEEQPPS